LGNNDENSLNIYRSRERKYDVIMEILEILKYDSQFVDPITLELVKQIREMIDSSRINIKNSSIGILNLGEIEDIKSISINILNLKGNGNSEIANALKFLTEALKTNQEIEIDQRTEFINQLEELSKQATLPLEKRKIGVIKAILTSLATGLGAAGGLAEVWSTWGHIIIKFFGF